MKLFFGAYQISIKATLKIPKAIPILFIKDKFSLKIIRPAKATKIIFKADLPWA